MTKRASLGPSSVSGVSAIDGKYTISPLLNKKLRSRITLLADMCPLHSLPKDVCVACCAVSFVGAYCPQTMSYPVLVQMFNVQRSHGLTQKETLVSEITHLIAFNYYAQPLSSIPGYGTVLA
jgi:hypothetical protein